mmetsp:Transcript_24389/g.46820  ORF Transcript_24389/g.46820 Transcript_24389/m.46820 type:complete len:175 (-) Transcript_24389:176-700(-)
MGPMVLSAGAAALGMTAPTALFAAAGSSQAAGNHGWVGALVLDEPDPDDCELRSAQGDSLYVEYQVFIDDKFQGKNKLEFKLGEAPVVGWNEHLANMCVDEERELTIPPSTHRHRNIGMSQNISRDAVLQFHIRLLDINGTFRKRAYASWKARDERARQRATQQRAVNAAKHDL